MMPAIRHLPAKFVAALLLAVSFAGPQLSLLRALPGPSTRIQTHAVALSQLPFTDTPYARVYVSDRIPATFAFDSIGASWRLPAGARVFLRTFSAAGTSSFAALHDDNPTSDVALSDPAFVREGAAFQYRVILPGGADLSDNDRLSFTYLSSPSRPADAIPQAYADALVRPRSAWGADENLRTVDGWLSARREYCARAGCTAALPEIRSATQAMPEAAERFPDEAKVIREDWKVDGKELLWPEEYVKSVRKLVVHHTAENLSDSIRSPEEISAEEYQAHIRSVYYYHAVVRGWGDIGYNYVIDPLGNVYQGRAGGDGVIGAHASGNNQGSVGISVMGNYEKGQPSSKAVTSLSRLLGSLGSRHRIDPQGQTSFRGKTGPTVLSHRDLGQTSCPGGNLYARLDDIRSEAHRSYLSAAQPASDASLVSGSTSLSGMVAQRVRVELRVRNDSAQAWKKGRIQLTLFRKRSRSMLYDSRSWESAVRPGTMLEDTVEPGQMATWRFDVVGRRVGVIEEQFQFNVLGRGWLKGDPLTLRLDVTKRVATARPTSSPVLSSPPPTFAPPTATPSTPTPTPAASSTNPEIRIRLGYGNADNRASFVAEKAAVVSSDTDSKLAKAGSTVTVTRASDGKMSATFDGQTVRGAYVHFAPIDGAIVRVSSWDRTPSWSKDGSVNYNQFRGAMRAISEDGRLKLVNYLLLEDYLMGIAESANDEPPEMRKLMSVLTRSYALHYADPAYRKFPGKPYDGSDSPAEYQYYLGYGFEKAAPNWAQTVRDTRGLVVKYDGKVIKTPYFSSSDGQTRDPQKVWGWSAPYLVPVDDSMCPDKVLRGHGVGLSACGARQQIREGKKYDEVIKYYYKGVTVEQA